MHTPKCGGTSISRALKESSIAYIPTSSINVNKNSQACKLILSPDTNWLVFGHSFHIPEPLTQEAKIKYLKIISILYSDTRILMPTRHPVQLMRSWMHYYKTRINQFIQSECSDSNYSPLDRLPKFSKLGRFHHIISQVCNSRYPSSPQIGFVLEAKDEQENLSNFLRAILFEKGLTPAWSHTLQLFYPHREQILSKLKRNIPFTLDLSSLLSDNRLFLYDSQVYSSIAVDQLTSHFGVTFVTRLLKLSENKSQLKNPFQTSNLHSFSATYSRLFPCEFQIYNKSN